MTTSDPRSLCTLPTTCPDCLGPKLASQPNCESCERYFSDPAERKLRECFRAVRAAPLPQMVRARTPAQLLAGIKGSKQAGRRRSENARRRKLTILNRQRRAREKSSQLRTCA